MADSPSRLQLPPPAPVLPSMHSESSRRFLATLAAGRRPATPERQRVRSYASARPLFSPVEPPDVNAGRPLYPGRLLGGRREDAEPILASAPVAPVEPADASKPLESSYVMLPPAGWRLEDTHLLTWLLISKQFSGAAVETAYRQFVFTRFWAPCLALVCTMCALFLYATISVIINRPRDATVIVLYSASMAAWALILAYLCLVRLRIGAFRWWPAVVGCAFVLAIVLVHTACYVCSNAAAVEPGTAFAIGCADTTLPNGFVPFMPYALALVRGREQAGEEEDEEERRGKGASEQASAVNNRTPRPAQRL